MGGEEAALRRRRGASSSPPGLHPGGSGRTQILARPPTNRRHDRFRYRRNGGAWEIERPVTAAAASPPKAAFS